MIQSRIFIFISKLVLGKNIARALESTICTNPVVIGTGIKENLAKSIQSCRNPVLVNGATSALSKVSFIPNYVFIGETMLLHDAEIASVELMRGVAAPHLRAKNSLFSQIRLKNLVCFGGPRGLRAPQVIYRLRLRCISIDESLVYISSLKILLIEKIIFLFYYFNSTTELLGDLGGALRLKKCSTGVRAIIIMSIYSKKVSSIGIQTGLETISLGDKNFNHHLFLSHQREDLICLDFLKRLGLYAH